MWHSKYKAVKYLGAAVSSSFGAFIGVRHFLSVRDLKAEIRADNAEDEVRFQCYIKSLAHFIKSFFFDMKNKVLYANTSRSLS